MLSLAALSGTVARELAADRAGASSTEWEPTYSDTATSSASDAGADELH
jgi:hypothetical protein